MFPMSNVNDLTGDTTKTRYVIKCFCKIVLLENIWKCKLQPSVSWSRQSFHNPQQSPDSSDIKTRYCREVSLAHVSPLRIDEIGAVSDIVSRMPKRSIKTP